MLRLFILDIYNADGIMVMIKGVTIPESPLKTQEHI